MKTVSLNPVPTPHLARFIAFKDEYGTHDRNLTTKLSSYLVAGREALRLKRAEWSKLNLRQTWADEAFMRQHIKAAGLRINHDTEPATVTRLRSLLRRAGVSGVETAESVGVSLAGFLTMNTGLPLWAALALVLEAIGRFTSPHKTGDA